MRTSSWARITVVPICPNWDDGSPNRSSHVWLSRPIVIDYLCLELGDFQLALIHLSFSSRRRNSGTNLYDLAVGVLISLIPPLFLYLWRGREFRDEYAVFDYPPLPLFYDTKEGSLLHDVLKASCSGHAWCFARYFGSSLSLPPPLLITMSLHLLGPYPLYCISPLGDILLILSVRSSYERRNSTSD